MKLHYILLVGMLISGLQVDAAYSTRESSTAIMSAPLAARLSAAKNIGDKLKAYEGNSAAEFQKIRELNDQGAFKNLTIGEIVVLFPQLKVFADKLRTVAPDVLAKLREPNSYFTLLAPTNDAFQKVAQLPGDLKNNERNLIQHHLIKELQLPASKLTAATAINNTVANKQLLGADLTDKLAVEDIQAKNGIIHISKEVLIGRESRPVILDKSMAVRPGYFPERRSPVVTPVVPTR